MLKNERLKYYLIPIVLLIWGRAIWSIFGGGEAAGSFSESQPPVIVDALKAKKDSFSLIMDYRDPFLGKPRTVRNQLPASVAVPDNASSLIENTTPKKDTATPKPALIWNTVAYSGLSRVSGDSVAVGIMQVKGRTYYVEKGKVYQGVEVLRIYEDSIALRYHEEMRTLIR